MTYSSGAAEYKQCPECGKVQDTKEDKCPFCGTEYPGAPPVEIPEGLHQSQSTVSLLESVFASKEILTVVSVICMVLIFIVWVKSEEAQRDQAATTFRKEIAQAGRPRVIDFYATWCGPCKGYAPTFKSVEEKFANQVDFQSCNIADRQSKKLVYAYDVHSYPTTVFLDRDGKTRDKLLGAMSEERLTEAVKDLVKKNY